MMCHLLSNVSSSINCLIRVNYLFSVDGAFVVLAAFLRVCDMSPISLLNLVFNAFSVDILHSV